MKALFFYLLGNETVVGPVTKPQLLSLLEEGQLTPRSLIVPAGSESWAAFEDLITIPPPPKPQTEPVSLRKGIAGTIGAAIAFPNPITIPLAAGVIGYEIWRQCKSDKAYNAANSRLPYDGSRDWPLVVGETSDITLSCKECHSIYRGHPASLICKPCWERKPIGSLAQLEATTEGLKARNPFEKPRTIFEWKQSFRRSAAWNGLGLFIFGIIAIAAFSEHREGDSSLSFGFIFLVLCILLARNIWNSYFRAKENGAFSLPTRPVPFRNWW